MLHFQGIRTNRTGAPERFSLKMNLHRSLEVVMVIFNHFQGEKSAVLDSIDQSLDEHFSNGVASKQVKAEQRKVAAQWLRARDVAHFLYADPQLFKLKANVLGLLNTPQSVAKKWSLICPILCAAIEEMPLDLAQTVLLDPHSGWHQLLDAIALFFLDQDKEKPPQHLEMSFVSRQFPERIWKQKEGLSPRSTPFWKPQNPLCDRLVLGQLVLEQLFERKVRRWELSQASLPVKTDVGEARLCFQAGPQAEMLIKPSPTETFLALQKEVQRQGSYEGSKHLLALLRQVSQATGERFDFSLDEHFQLLGKKKPNREVSQRQRHLFDQTLKLVGDLKVQRTQGDCTRETPLLALLSKESQPGRLGTVELILDPLFRALRLGLHLTALPNQVFLENPQTHGLVPGLLAHFTGSWFFEYPQKKGVFTCKAEQLTEVFLMQKSNKQRLSFLQRIKEELGYMVKRSYIGGFQASPSPNPLESEYQITAPATLLTTWAHQPPQLI